MEKSGAPLLLIECRDRKLNQPSVVSVSVLRYENPKKEVARLNRKRANRRSNETRCLALVKCSKAFLGPREYRERLPYVLGHVPIANYFRRLAPPRQSSTSRRGQVRHRENSLWMASCLRCSPNLLDVRCCSSVGPVAQRLEQRTHNPLVPGSNPGGPTNKIFKSVFSSQLVSRSECFLGFGNI
jgi:hypothetical protein